MKSTYNCKFSKYSNYTHIFSVFANTFSYDIKSIQLFLDGYAVKTFLQGFSVIILSDIPYKDLELEEFYCTLSRVCKNLGYIQYFIDSALYSKAAAISTRYYLRFCKKSLLPSWLLRTSSNELFFYLCQPALLFRLYLLSLSNILKSNLILCSPCLAYLTLDRIHLNGSLRLHSLFSLIPRRRPFHFQNTNLIFGLKLLSTSFLYSILFNLYKSCMRLWRILCQPSVSTYHAMNNGGESKSLILLTGNAECEALSFLYKSSFNTLFLALPIAASNLSRKNINFFSLRRISFLHSCFFCTFFVLYTPLCLLFFLILSFYQFLIALCRVNTLFSCFSIYCLRSFPHNFATFLITFVFACRIKPSKLISANNIDSNLSIFTYVANCLKIEHHVIQCTSLERIPLPNYGDCHRYYCESDSYAFFLRTLVREQGRMCDFRSSSPSISEFLIHYNNAFSSNSGFRFPCCQQLTPSLRIGVPSQAEFLDILPILISLIKCSHIFSSFVTISINLRLHPRETDISIIRFKDLSLRFPGILTITSNFTPLSQWLACQHLIVGSSSTVLYWAELVNKPICSVLFPSNIYLKGLLPHIPQSALRFKNQSSLDYLLYCFLHFFVLQSYFIRTFSGYSL